MALLLFAAACASAAASSSSSLAALSDDEVSSMIALLQSELSLRTNGTGRFASTTGATAGSNGNPTMVGKTTLQFDGDQTFGMYDYNGYDDVKSRCVEAFPAPAAPSHVCDAHELAMIAQGDGKLPNGVYWYIDLSMTHWVDEAHNLTTVVQDCSGWSSKLPSQYGNCVNYAMVGGTVLPTICSCERKLQFICCEDYVN